MFEHSGAKYASVAALISCIALLLGACAPGTPQPASAGTPAPGLAQPVVLKPTASDAASTGPSAGLEGRWEGPVAVAGQSIVMVVKLSGSGSDMKGQLDVPAQGAKDLPLKKITYQAPKLHFEAFEGAGLATFDAELKGDGTLAGDFGQAGYKGTFTFKRAAAAAPPTAVPVPYKEEEVTFQNGDAKLAGTLTTPQGSGSFPAVVLITGSGPEDRDETVFGFKPFRIIADSFTRQGIAVLRYDDRGVGGSTGDTENATSEDLAGDVTAAVALLRTRPDINSKAIGVMGHSEGGIIGPIAATRSQDISFVILLGGPGLPGKEVLVQQAGDVAKASGAPQAQVDAIMVEQRKVVDAVMTGQGLDEVKAKLIQQAQAQVAALPAEQQKALGTDPAGAAQKQVEAQIAAMQSPWFQYFLKYDPAPTLAKVKVPVLAIFGGKDVQVAAGPNEAAVKAALAQAGNTHVTTRVYPDANHLFQAAKTGGVQEYSQRKDMVPGLLDETAQWIKDTVEG
jgi:pimeloyl-ACP methyl ester carboxylesterase